MILSEWIKKQNFQFQKANERPWGSYEVSVSTDGKQWIKFPNVFGWGFSPERAFEIIMTNELARNSWHPQLKQWLGDERFGEYLKCSVLPMETGSVNLPSTA
jgi:hypothetical protein